MNPTGPKLPPLKILVYRADGATSIAKASFAHLFGEQARPEPKIDPKAEFEALFAGGAK